MHTFSRFYDRALADLAREGVTIIDPETNKARVGLVYKKERDTVAVSAHGVKLELNANTGVIVMPRIDFANACAYSRLSGAIDTTMLVDFVYERQKLAPIVAEALILIARMVEFMRDQERGLERLRDRLLIRERSEFQFSGQASEYVGGTNPYLNRALLRVSAPARYVLGDGVDRDLNITVETAVSHSGKSSAVSLGKVLPSLFQEDSEDTRYAELEPAEVSQRLQRVVTKDFVIQHPEILAVLW